MRNVKGAAVCHVNGERTERGRTVCGGVAGSSSGLSSRGLAGHVKQRTVNQSYHDRRRTEIFATHCEQPCDSRRLMRKGILEALGNGQ